MTRPIRAVVSVFCVSLTVALGAGCMASDQQIVQQASQFNSGIAPAEIQHPMTTAYFQQIGARIVAAAKQLDAQGVGPKTHFQDKDRAWMFQDIHWELVNSKTVNAFTTGGHYVYVYDQLYQMCKNEDELAAVMCHEYGHIYCRHVQKGTGRQEALAALSVAAAGAGYAAGGKQNGSQYAQSAMSAAQAGGGFLNMGFTRQDEAQADQFGFKFYTQAGWPPDHFGDFFKEMIAAGYDTTPAIASDHPTLASRVQAADKRAAEITAAEKQALAKPNVATQAQFDQYKQAALQASQGMPNDQQVLQAKNLLQALPRSCWLPYEPQDEAEAQQKIIDDAKRAQAQQNAER